MALLLAADGERTGDLLVSRRGPAEGNLGGLEELSAGSVRVGPGREAERPRESEERGLPFRLEAREWALLAIL